MKADRAKKGPQLTLVDVTRLTSQRDTGLMAADVRQLTPEIKSRRAYKPRARKCKCGCQEMVTPTRQAPHKLFFSDACRQRYNRAKAARLRKAQPTNGPVLELMICEFCRNEFLGESGKGAKYCKPSHRVMAAELRRNAAISAVADCMSVSYEQAVETVKGLGMKLITKYLHQQELHYDPIERDWLPALRLVVTAQFPQSEQLIGYELPTGS